MPASPAFQLLRPARALAPVVFASPHSGCDYPDAFLDASQLDPLALRSSEDAFVDRLFDCAPESGAPLLTARVPRAWLDLNRAPDELDPALIEGLGRGAHNPRVASGLGVIPRVVSAGRLIYRGKMSRAEAETRIADFWTPYHAALRGLLEETHAAFGEVLLLDCHSMPREALDAHLRPGGLRPEVVIGDRFGASAAARHMDMIEAEFQAAGLRVARNTPFAGAYVTQAYGRPSRGMHAIQIEIDRSLYMDEARILPRSDFEDFRSLIGGVVRRIITRMGGGGEVALAAE